MYRVSRLYRFAALAGLLAIAWAIALPVVHMACAGEFMAALAGEYHGMAGELSDCHTPSQSPDNGDSDPNPVDMSCCLVGMSPIDGTVAPGSFVKNLKVAVAVADLPQTASPFSYRQSEVGRRSAPYLPAPSHLFFSVLLI